MESISLTLHFKRFSLAPCTGSPSPALPPLASIQALLSESLALETY